MSTPSLPDSADESTSKQPKGIALVAIGVVAFAAIMVALHLTGVVG